jgi:hypothetical protein
MKHAILVLIGWGLLAASGAFAEEGSGAGSVSEAEQAHLTPAAPADSSQVQLLATGQVYVTDDPHAVVNGETPWTDDTKGPMFNSLSDLQIRAHWKTLAQETPVTLHPGRPVRLVVADVADWRWRTTFPLEASISPGKIELLLKMVTDREPHILNYMPSLFSASTTIGPLDAGEYAVYLSQLLCGRVSVR